MLNFRKLKQDYSPAILKDGKVLYDENAVSSAKIVEMDGSTLNISGRVLGAYDHWYESEVEIDWQESETMDSNCDCPYPYDCQHLTALIFFLEKNFDKILVTYSKEADLEDSPKIDDTEKKELLDTFQEAASKEVVRQGKQYERDLLSEYRGASEILGQNPFFLPEDSLEVNKAELAVIFSYQSQKIFDHHNSPEIQLALRLPYRSKPLHVLNIKDFLDAVRYREPQYLGGKQYLFTTDSFDDDGRQVLMMIMNYARFPDSKGERSGRVAQVESENFGTILAKSYFRQVGGGSSRGQSASEDQEPVTMSSFYCGSLEEPLILANSPATLRFELEYLQAPSPKILLKPTVVIDGQEGIDLEEICIFECASPGLIHNNAYYRFPSSIRRKHLRTLGAIRDVTIPEPLFGTFVENALPELMRFAEVGNREAIERFVTLPFVGEVQAVCDINYLNGELEANLYFVYDEIKVPAAEMQLNVADITTFVTNEGVLARNLAEEQKIIDDLFQGFVFDQEQGSYLAKTEKKIVEFMTEVIPRNQNRVTFNCPENLLDQFIFDDTSFTLTLREVDTIAFYEVELKVDGHLAGTTVDHLWECLAMRRAFIELKKHPSTRGKKATAKFCKILVLDLDRLAPVIQIFDEMGIKVLDNHTEQRPLWSLASLDAKLFKGLPIKFKMSKRLKEVQEQILGSKEMQNLPIPKEINAVLRSYQEEGVHWLERLRQMHLNGILADDMGLGKTLQAIVAITQINLGNAAAISMVVCPTSLVYNWKKEFGKFNPELDVLVVDGTPVQRKKLLKNFSQYQVVITSYSLMQKDIELYQNTTFACAILDEAQHIKNRGTRNAKSVKKINAAHRLILTGTPIENSLEELWSLFDFLMPGLLSSYERFVEKYIRPSQYADGEHLKRLRQKVSPFILRRMKQDVLKDLPPVSEILYHCHLSETQHELYKSYADSAREELSQLVKKEGFEKVQIHVLATLTRLKQICCHPAIFAKERAEVGDSSKYDMLMELLPTLIEGNHKTVIFSQYTRMLGIMREDLKKMGIRFSYLDGSSKNRLDIVEEFNDNKNIPVFLVSLKAGGSGLNLVGADTVIHYDMWWNPAVENQATDRVHRIGQTRSVSSYKLITLGTIEEKIVEMQNRKRGLVKQIVSEDEEVIAKLTWEEVLELLQT